MKFLFIVDDFSDGAGNMAQILAQRLITEGHIVSMLLTYKHSDPRYVLQNFNVYDINFSEFHGTRPIRLLKQIAAVRRTIDDTHCELIISFICNNNIIVCFAAEGTDIPVIVSERSNPVEVKPRFPWNILRRIAYKRADIVSVQFDCLKHFDGDRYVSKCYTTHNIIMLPGNVKNIWQEDRVSFVSLARYSEIKRFELMIRLFSELGHEYKNCELHIYGRGVVNEKLESVISDCGNGRVYLHEAILNVYDELTKHDVYLMTSMQEGFPNSLSEALAVGLPVIAFRCHDGISKLVQNGVNGYCVNEGDTTTFINSMRILASDISTRKKYGEESQKIAAYYSESTVMEEWHKCIDTAMKNRRNTL